MRIILVGPPGGGKGTLGNGLSDVLSLPVVTISGLIRAAQHDTRANIEAQMARGVLIDDSIVFALVRERVAKDDCRNGFIFDGFPRTLTQAQFVQSSLTGPFHLLHLDVDDAVITTRLCGRRVHTASGRVYHLEHKPPKEAGLDDITHEPDVVLQRLAIYHQEAQQILDWAKRSTAIQEIHTLDATLAPEDLVAAAQHVLSSV